MTKTRELTSLRIEHTTRMYRSRHPREAEERMNAGYECVDWYFCKKDLD